jgi:hypothetical protein
MPKQKNEAIIIYDVDGNHVAVVLLKDRDPADVWQLWLEAEAKAEKVTVEEVKQYVDFEEVFLSNL